MGNTNIQPGSAQNNTFARNNMTVGNQGFEQRHHTAPSRNEVIYEKKEAENRNSLRKSNKEMTMEAKKSDLTKYLSGTRFSQAEAPK